MSGQAQQARRIVYRGRVQGVGFRYRVSQIAEGRAVAGYVRNLRDGRVEVVVEGSARELDILMQRITGAMEGYIEGAEVESLTPSGEFTSFEVR